MATPLARRLDVTFSCGDEPMKLVAFVAPSHPSPDDAINYVIEKWRRHFRPKAVVKDIEISEVGNEPWPIVAKSFLFKGMGIRVVGP